MDKQAGDGRLDELRLDAWARALWAVGTAKIFEVRARALRRKIALLTYGGLAVPVMIGATVLAYGVHVSFLPTLVTLAAALLIIQALVALWSLVADWPGNLERAVRSLVANEALAQRFESLGKTPSNSPEGLRQELAVVASADDVQRQQDQTLNVSEREKRMGYRAALLRYQRRCPTCDETPSSMKPSKCGVCGDF
ncbi:MAG: putative rane protein [Frankiales bacterium]|nr:putative rane protein [Frankiales bacterium]